MRLCVCALSLVWLGEKVPCPPFGSVGFIIKCTRLYCAFPIKQLAASRRYACVEFPFDSIQYTTVCLCLAFEFWLTRKKYNQIDSTNRIIKIRWRTFSHNSTKIGNLHLRVLSPHRQVVFEIPTFS